MRACFSRKSDDTFWRIRDTLMPAALFPCCQLQFGSNSDLDSDDNRTPPEEAGIGVARVFSTGTEDPAVSYIILNDLFPLPRPACSRSTECGWTDTRILRSSHAVEMQLGVYSSHYYSSERCCNTATACLPQ